MNTYQGQEVGGAEYWRQVAQSFQDERNILYLDWGEGYVTIQLPKFTNCTVSELTLFKLYLIKAIKNKATKPWICHFFVLRYINIQVTVKSDCP